MSFDVDAKFSLHFDRLDGEIGRKIYFGTDFMIRPFFGIEGLLLSQIIKERHLTVFQSLDNGDPVKDLLTVDNKNRLLSIGPKGGFNGSFYLGKGFGFSGALSGSILWGRFHIKQQFDQNDTYLNGTVLILGEELIDHSHYASIFNCDINLGVEWSYLFSNDKKMVTLKFGWEDHFYTNINRFQNYYIEEVNSSNAIYSFDRNLQKGNLALSGFTFGCSLYY
jgi:hypothetical protein